MSISLGVIAQRFNLSNFNEHFVFYSSAEWRFDAEFIAHMWEVAGEKLGVYGQDPRKITERTFPAVL